MSSLTTFDEITRFRAKTIAMGCRLYAHTGMVPNRNWTPTAMLKAASEITGTTYRKGQHKQAHADIMDLLNKGVR